MRATAVALLAGAAFVGTLEKPSCARAADKITISGAYGETYGFDTEDLTKERWGGMSGCLSRLDIGGLTKREQ